MRRAGTFAARQRLDWPRFAPHIRPTQPEKLMNSQPQRADFGHWRKIPTRWSDLDLLGHVNNARFFGFDEDARLDYFSSLWKDDQRFWKDYGFILANLGCDFIAQLHHPAEVEAGFRITRLGRSSMQTMAGFYLGDKLIAVTRGVLVWFNYADQKPQPIPDHVRALIRGREHVAPAET